MTSERKENDVSVHVQAKPRRQRFRCPVCFHEWVVRPPAPTCGCEYPKWNTMEAVTRMRRPGRAAPNA